MNSDSCSDSDWPPCTTSPTPSCLLPPDPSLRRLLSSHATAGRSSKITMRRIYEQRPCHAKNMAQAGRCDDSEPREGQPHSSVPHCRWHQHRPARQLRTQAAKKSAVVCLRSPEQLTSIQASWRRLSTPRNATNSITERGRAGMAVPRQCPPNLTSLASVI